MFEGLRKAASDPGMAYASIVAVLALLLLAAVLALAVRSWLLAGRP